MYKDDSLYDSSGLRALFNGTMMMFMNHSEWGLKARSLTTKLHHQSDKIVRVIERDMKMVEPSDWDGFYLSRCQLLLELIMDVYERRAIIAEILLKWISE